MYVGDLKVSMLIEDEGMLYEVVSVLYYMPTAPMIHINTHTYYQFFLLLTCLPGCDGGWKYYCLLDE